jgi:lipoprotein-anchoring transpeptidase ErfK/SrfK
MSRTERRIVAAVVACVVGFVLAGTIDARAQLPEPKLIVPTPTPDPTPTPKPTPKPEPKPKPKHPPLPANSGEGRRVVYSNPKQRVWIVDKGQHVIGSWLVSGRENIPSGGNYRVFSRSRYSRSMNGQYRIEYMVRFAHGRSADIGFHSIPVDDNGRPAQSEDELGTYQSAGCVRQKKSDAAKMWDFAQLDTRVVVTY